MKQKFRFFILLTLFAVCIATGLSGRSPVAKIDSISGKEVIVTGGNIGRNLPRLADGYFMIKETQMAAGDILRQLLKIFRLGRRYLLC